MLKIIIILVLLLFAGGAATVGDETYSVNPVPVSEICIEGFTLYHGMIFIVKSQIVPGEFYWDAGNWQQKHKKVWMEIYAAVGTQIRLIKIVEGRVIPPTPERFSFEGKSDAIPR